MANYYTRFSFGVDVPPSEVEVLREVLESANSTHGEEIALGVALDHYDESEEIAYITHPDGGRGEPQDAGLVLSRFLSRIGSEETITFTYADTCSKKRPDSFAGGLVIVDQDGYNVESAFGWRQQAERLAGEEGKYRVQIEETVQQAGGPEEAARLVQRRLGLEEKRIECKVEEPARFEFTLEAQT